MRKIFFIITLSTVSWAYAQEDADFNALQLADQTQTTTKAPSNWRAFTEASVGGSTLRSHNDFQSQQRLSLDVQYDNSFAPGWRALFSDRLDINWPAISSAGNTVNTIREGYLSWQAQPDLIVDFGRINERNGVALAYNPTDFFKTNALRSIDSIDPKSLKENRQGSVMLRVQKLSDTSSISVLFSPKLTDPNMDGATSSFNPDFAATNHEHRWLISYSKKIVEGINPQLLLFKSEKLPVQLGFNLTGLLNDATVLFFEWSGGRRPSLLTQAFQQQGLAVTDDTAFRQRIATGLTYTTSNKISLTAELDYNGAGQDHASQLGSPILDSAYRTFLLANQESPTKHSAFLYGTWQDAGINHLDASAMTRFNLSDSSRLSWLELRYRFPSAELALQWQRYSGNPLSEFGAINRMQTWALIGRVYF